MYYVVNHWPMIFEIWTRIVVVDGRSSWKAPNITGHLRCICDDKIGSCPPGRQPFNDLHKQICIKLSMQALLRLLNVDRGLCQFVSYLLHMRLLVREKFEGMDLKPSLARRQRLRGAIATEKS